ncbi:hypothetical protein P8452_76902 [Trifolium repens]|nr:hypothetical protein P8452_76902 [Trifolium repens]
MAKSASSLLQKLKGFIKKPWEITGPVSHPEYKSALPGALEYRVYCPATTKEKAIIPTSDPETVYDIKYYTRDQRRMKLPMMSPNFPQFILTLLLRRITMLVVVDTSHRFVLSWDYIIDPVNFLFLLMRMSASFSTDL